MHGFKKTFTSVDISDSYQEMPMELDSDEDDLTEQRNSIFPAYPSSLAPPPPPLSTSLVPAPVSDPRLKPTDTKSLIYQNLRPDPLSLPPSLPSAPTQEINWSVPTQTYRTSVFRARPEPQIRCVLPPPPPPPCLPSPIDLAHVPLPIQPPPPAFPPPPLIHPPTPPTPPQNLVHVKHEIIPVIDLSPDRKPKEVFIVSSDSVSWKFRKLFILDIFIEWYTDWLVIVFIVLVL